ncbi:UNVERIFIED_CONTAM: hypothetical protein Sangu_1639600 [Sesamum angustifolium]|uniref:Uncharacterized protein n=1 Tax=Sesamum angustifolium TaxID=2727405 RepID=A0AAW2MLD5_9LAMI
MPLVAFVRDPLIGTVRFLASLLFPLVIKWVPSFTNTARLLEDSKAFLIWVGSFSKWNGTSGIGYRDLMGESIGRRQKKLPPCDLKKSVSMREIRNSVRILVVAIHQNFHQTVLNLRLHRLLQHHQERLELC